MGQGKAFTALADNSSSIHYNPEGKARLRGIHHTAGVQIINPNTRFTNPTEVKAEAAQSTHTHFQGLRESVASRESKELRQNQGFLEVPLS